MLKLILSTLLLLNSCAIIKNHPQESKFMKVSRGGYFLNSERQLEETYGLVVNFKNIPDNAKYLIADFEIPNNPGQYDRKIYPINKNQSHEFIKSNPIYGFKYGFYFIKLSLAEDKKGEKIIDSLYQSIRLYIGHSKGRDYAVQYTLFGGKEEIKKMIVIFPNERNKDLLIADISSEFKMGHAVVTSDESVVEYVPNKESVFNWSKIITLKENKVIDEKMNKPAIYSTILGNGMYKKFSKLDKDIQITYTGRLKGKFINVETPNFQELAMDAEEIAVYVDYSDPLTIKKYPYQREYLVAKTAKSGISIWELQCTVRYDKRWPKEKIELWKEEAARTANSLRYSKNNLADNLEKIAIENGIKDFSLESQRLDDRDLNIKFKEMNK